MSPECYPNDTDVIKHTTRRFSDQTAGNPLHQNENDDTTVMMRLTGSRIGQCMLQMVADWQAVTIGMVDWIGEIHVGRGDTVTRARRTGHVPTDSRLIIPHSRHDAPQATQAHAC